MTKPRHSMRSSLLLIVVATLLLTTCSRCPDTILLDHGPLPDEAMQYVPYRNGQSVTFRHSLDRMTTFNILQMKYTQTTSCAECCKYNVRYETLRTELIPNYPLFTIVLEISNIDTSVFYFTVSVGNSGFLIPTNGPDDPEVEILDSVLIDTEWYYQVYKLNARWGDPGEEISYADTLLYNYTEGIVKIIMSNGEYYELSKD